MGRDGSGFGDLDLSKYTFTLPDGTQLYYPPNGSRTILWGSPESGAFADMLYPGHREYMIGAQYFNMRGRQTDTTLLIPTMNDLPGFESEPSSMMPDPDMIIPGYYPQGYGMGEGSQPVNQFNFWHSLALTPNQAAVMNQNITITVLDADNSVW